MAKKPKSKSKKQDLAKGPPLPLPEPPTPSGEAIRILRFGGAISDPQAGDYISLEWGSGTDWEILAATTSENDFDWKRFTRAGDGTKHLRIVLSNNDKTKPYFYWLDAVEAPPL